MRVNTFQSTLPARGATRGALTSRERVENFNPRSPRGERHGIRYCSLCNRPISIHAPREGSDAPRQTQGVPDMDFNPRSPRGERPPLLRHCISYSRFQSTLPARGATLSAYHTSSSAFYFNPRSPRGERRGGAEWGENRRGISIHAPREGSDR